MLKNLGRLGYMAYKVEYKSETVRFKLLYGEYNNVEKIKLHINKGFVTGKDVRTGLKFLERQGLHINKRHPKRLTVERIQEFLGKTCEFEITPNVKVSLVDDDRLDEITIQNVGVIDNKFILDEGINHLVDFLVVFFAYYNPTRLD